MTVTIDGTNGVSAVQNGIVVPADLSTGAPTWDTAGNVGVGVTPSAWSVSAKVLELGTTSGFWHYAGLLTAISNNSRYPGTSHIYKTNGYAQHYEMRNDTGGYSWAIAPSGTAGNPITFTQAMTLDAGGNLLVGTAFTNPSSGGVAVLPASGATIINQGHISGTAAGSAYSQFLYNGTVIGSITQNGTTAVAYNTTSDHRLKTNVRPADANSFMQVQFRDFEWVDGRHDCGVIAHELQAVYPDLVTGEKDAVDSEGNPVYQQVNYTGLICRMGTMIQKQQALIEQLTARITALEAK